MRRIIVPAPIDVGGQSYGLEQFVLALMAGERFNKEWKGLSAAHRICQAFHSETSSCVKLGTSDWELLEAEAKAPSGGYPVKPAVGVFVFVQAIVEATEDGD